MEQLEHKIELANFYGPLDLLLHLIKEDELNIYDIPIARVTDQYIKYLEMMQKLDINLAGEFMVMASTLMEIKSKTLMPREEEEQPEEEDPRFELVRKLIEYKKYKDFSRQFSSLMEERSKKCGRPETILQATLIILNQPRLQRDQPLKEEAKETLIELDLWTLVRSFSRLSRETTLDISTSILYDDVPIEQFIENIINRLKQVSSLMFSELVGQPTDCFKVVKNLLASLELARQKRIELEQEKDFADIKLTIRPEPEHLE